MTIPKASVIDLFCGVGGLTHGFKKEGFHIACGIDIDQACQEPFEKNNGARFLHRDIADITSADLKAAFPPNSLRILIGCAPCQPYARHNHKKNDLRWKTMQDFLRLVKDVEPEIISMENVPALMKFQGGSLFSDFTKTLENLKYKVWNEVVFCPDYGVPQMRRRLVLLASRLGQIQLEEASHKKKNYVRVGDVIKNLPEIQAGETDSKDPLHRSSMLSDINLKRIKASKPSGTWEDWDEKIRLPCHKRKRGKDFKGVYGRMTYNGLSPTITTQFHGYSRGRFGHPEQNRAISLREGSLLQTFPKDYIFTSHKKQTSIVEIARMIGNAVPYKLARSIARSIKKHLQENSYA